MNKQSISKLSKLTLDSQNNINADIANYVLSSLSRSELSTYFKYLKAQISSKFVKVVTSEPLSSTLKNNLKTKYKGLPVIFDLDKKIGDGLRVIHNDSVEDFTINSYITSTLNSLKK